MGINNLLLAELGAFLGAQFKVIDSESCGLICRLVGTGDGCNTVLEVVAQLHLCPALAVLLADCSQLCLVLFVDNEHAGGYAEAEGRVGNGLDALFLSQLNDLSIAVRGVAAHFVDHGVEINTREKLGHMLHLKVGNADCKEKAFLV